MQWWLRRAKWCRLNHTDGKTGPEGEIMIAPQQHHKPQCTNVYGLDLYVNLWNCVHVAFLHQDRNVTVCTAHSLCKVYTRVAALLAAQMTPPEIKLNYRRFSRTMIQREMKVNFDFSPLPAAHGGKSEALMAAHCGQGGIMAPLLCRCGFK